MAGTVETWLEQDFEERWTDFAEDDRDTGEQTGIEVPVEDDAGAERPSVRSLAVVERDLPGHLFGFTRRGSSHVVVNNRLYRVDRERTVRHEKTHHRFPKDEMTIRYINGDPDVRHTLSFKGNTPARLGTGSTGRPTNHAAYSAGGADRYGHDSGTYL